jgi:hypothetical protein
MPKDYNLYVKRLHMDLVYIRGEHKKRMSKIYLSSNGTFEVNEQTVWKETEYGLFFFQ